MRVRRSLILTLVLFPTLVIGISAKCARPKPVDPPASRALIDAAGTDPIALVNVSAADMPASPDILFLGKRSTRALERCLSDNADAHLRALCAGMLGTLGDRSALPALHAALGDWEAEVRREVIRALGKLPADQSVDPLLALYARGDEEVGVRHAILRTLGAIGHSKGVALIRRELDKSRKELAGPGGDLRRTALQSLWRCRHRVSPGVIVDEVTRALAPPRGNDRLIEKMLEANDAELTRDAIAKASQLRSGRFMTALIALIFSPDDKTQNRAIQALGLLGDKRAVPALAKLLPTARNARLLNNIAFALQRLDDRAFTHEIQRMVTHKQGVIRMNAAFVLGDIRQPKSLPLLERSLADPSERVQLEAVRAISKLAPAPEAVRLLEKATASKSAGVRETAIQAVAHHGNERSIPLLEKLLGQPGQPDEMILHAIYRLSAGKRSDLIYERLFRGDDDDVRKRAAIVLGKAGDRRVRDYLIACFETDRCGLDDVEAFLRTEKDPVLAGQVLWMWLRGRDDLTDLVGAMRPAGAATLAGNGLDVAVIRGEWPHAGRIATLLGDLHAEAERPHLQAAANAADGWFRIRALVTRCRLGDGDAAMALLRELDNFPIEWLPELVDALHGLREPDARTRLAGDLERRQGGREPTTALAAAATRLPWTPDAALPRLLAGMTAADVVERETAERYLRHDHTPRVEVLLAERQAKERNPELRARLLRLIDVRRGN
ncbi:MAG TPA: HEAT repeat domain-containing protein [Polyangia bacterium]